MGEAALATLPTGPGQRNRCVFDFARALKAVPRFVDAPATSFRDIVREWHRRARDIISTKPFEETWIDFLKAWRSIKHPLGSGPIVEAFKRAEAPAVPERAAGYEQASVRLLAKLCRELQGHWRDQPFFLSCRTAGTLLGAPHTTAASWLFLLRSDGIVVEVERGGQAHNPRKASRYRWIGDACTSRSSEVDSPHGDDNGTAPGGA